MLSRITYFAKNSKSEFLTWTQSFTKSCTKVCKEVQDWNATQDDGG